MIITLLFCLIYMYWASVPHAPFGKREVWGLLVARGLGGFFGGTCKPVGGNEHFTDCIHSFWILL